MAVKDDPHAAQIITKEGQSLKFDDIGCMNEWKTKNGTGAIGAEYVRDFRTKQWLKYEKAYYVYDPSLQTPMAYGIVSFEKKEDAEAFMKEEGTGVLMTAKELDGHSWARNREMMKMGGMGAHSHGENGERNEEHSGSGMGGSGGHR
jgi:copper chaperone NosL